jgi:hypothetical protein
VTTAIKVAPMVEARMVAMKARVTATRESTLVVAIGKETLGATRKVAPGVARGTTPVAQFGH